MELQKKTLPVEEANGWYLMQTEKRYWEETEIDEETGNQTQWNDPKLFAEKVLR